VAAGRAAIGLPELDEMLRGGLNRGTITFLAGSPGAGKTLTALHYIMAGAADGEPGLFVCFNESEEQLCLKAENFGLDLRGAIARGEIFLLCLAPVELEVDVFAAKLRNRVEGLRIRRLVIDSIASIEGAILEHDHDQVVEAVARRDGMLLDMAMDVLVPPLSYLFVTAAAGMALGQLVARTVSEADRDRSGRARTRGGIDLAHVRGGRRGADRGGDGRRYRRAGA